MSGSGATRQGAVPLRLPCQFFHEPSRTVGSSAAARAHALKHAPRLSYSFRNATPRPALSSQRAHDGPNFLGILVIVRLSVVNLTGNVTVAILRPHHPETRKDAHG